MNESEGPASCPRRGPGADQCRYVFLGCRGELHWTELPAPLPSPCTDERSDPLFPCTREVHTHTQPHVGRLQSNCCWWSWVAGEIQAEEKWRFVCLRRSRSLADCYCACARIRCICTCRHCTYRSETKRRRSSQALRNC